MGAPPPHAEIYDPVEVEMEQLKAIDASSIELDVTSPVVVRFLAQQSTVRLLELRRQRGVISHQQGKLDGLRTDKENLRVENATLSAQQRVSWIEFLAGIVCGFAVNLLTVDPGSLLGWPLLILGVSVFGILRSSQRRTPSEANRLGG